MKIIGRIFTISQRVILSLLLLLSLISCVDVTEHEDTPEGNFEALWRIIDEHYCFFDYKQQVYGLDWDAIYNIYKVRAKGPMNDYQLFEVLTDMLSELKDGHVNLYTSFDNGRRHAAAPLPRYRLPHRLRRPVQDPRR